MNKEQEGKIAKYWDLMRGAVRSDDYITATVLISVSVSREAHIPKRKTPINGLFQPFMGVLI